MYPKKAQNVAKVLRDLYEEFRALKKIPKPRQTEAWVQDKVEPWLGSLNVGLDIRTTDVGFRSRQEELFGVKETDVEEAFWNDQINGKRVGFCETFVDKKWLATDARRKRDLEGWKKRLERSEKDKKVLEERVEVPEEYDIDGNQNNPDFVDRNYDDEEKDNHKKRRRSYVAAGSVENTGSLPEHYRHVRKSIHGVRPEVYTALDRYFKRETCPERNIYPSCSCHGRYIYIYKYNV